MRNRMCRFLIVSLQLNYSGMVISMNNNDNPAVNNKYSHEPEEISRKQKVSVALKYTPGENQAPQVIASGRGYMAEKIIEKAKENSVPLYEDSGLANTLSKLEIGDVIPPELYNVVAEILVFVDDCDKIRGKMKKFI